MSKHRPRGGAVPSIPKPRRPRVVRFRTEDTLIYTTSDGAEYQVCALVIVTPLITPQGPISNFSLVGGGEIDPAHACLAALTRFRLGELRQAAEQASELEKSGFMVPKGVEFPAPEPDPDQEDPPETNA